MTTRDVGKGELKDRDFTLNKNNAKMLLYPQWVFLVLTHFIPTLYHLNVIICTDIHFIVSKSSLKIVLKIVRNRLGVGQAYRGMRVRLASRRVWGYEPDVISERSQISIIITLYTPFSTH